MAEIDNKPLVEIEEERTQPGLLGPKEMEEKERLATAAVELTQKTLEENVGKAATAPAQELEAVAPDAALATIQLKLSLGEDLTDEEKVIAAQVVAAPQVESTVIKIGGKELTEADAESKMRASTGIGNAELTPEAKKNLIDLWAKAENKKEANRSIDTGYKENAQTREENARAALAIRETRIQLESTASNLLGQQQEMLALQEELKAAAASTLSEEEIYDVDTGRPKIAEMNEFSAKIKAQQQLPKVEARITEVTKKIQDAQRNLAIAGFKEKQTMHPEYQTSESADIIVDKIHRNDPTLKKEDRIKVQELSRLIDEANAQRIPFEDQLEYARMTNNTAIKPSAQSARPSIPGIENLPDATTLQEQIAAFRKNRKSSPSSAGTGAPSGSGKSEKSIARQTIEHAHSIGIVGKGDDEFLKEIGY